MTRCIVVSGIVTAIDPAMPITTAAGSATTRPAAVNITKYPTAVPVRLAASSARGWTRPSRTRISGAPSRKPTPRHESSNPVSAVPPSRQTPNAISTALSEALAARKMTVTRSNALAVR
jgi:hypothetical protein